MIAQNLSSKQNVIPALTLVLVFAALAGFFINARYAGLSADGDALSMSMAANSILVTHQLDGEGRYNNGFLYGALLAFASVLSGLSPNLLVSWGSVWVVVFVLTAFITYREVLGDAWLAVLSTLLLFLFPDLMFYVLRGGHERITWLLALLMLFLLARSLRYSQQPLLLLIHIGVFYLVFWGMVSTNVFFASTFASAIMIAFAGSRAVSFMKRLGMKGEYTREHLASRLMMVSLISLTLVFLFITYTYTPALSHYFFLGDFLNRMGGLVFGVQEDSGAPASYIYFGKAWRSMGLYVALVWPQFLIAATSFIRWLLDIRKLASFSDRRWFLWWLYAAFGLLLVLGTIADFAGFLQENLQMRMFTPFMLFAAPVAALALRVAITNMAKKRPRMAVLLGGVFIVYGMLACMAKVTNDPFFSNVWYFYGPGELRAGQWIDSTIQDQVVWVDTWHRLRSLYINSLGEYDQSRVYEFVAGSLDTFPPYILITENTRLSANRREVILPTVNNHNQIYDNGAAQLYYRRARTPYQR